MGIGYAVILLGKCPARAGSRQPVPTVPVCWDENAAWMWASSGFDDGKRTRTMCCWALRLRVECSEDGDEALMVCRFGRVQKREQQNLWRARRHFDGLFPGDLL
jgi:hypothetical protein